MKCSSPLCPGAPFVQCAPGKGPVTIHVSRALWRPSRCTDPAGYHHCARQRSSSAAPHHLRCSAKGKEATGPGSTPGDSTATGDSIAAPGDLMHGQEQLVGATKLTVWRDRRSERACCQREASDGTRWLDPRLLGHMVMGVDPVESTPAVQPRGQPHALLASCGLLLLAVLASRFWEYIIPGFRHIPLQAGYGSTGSGTQQVASASVTSQGSAGEGVGRGSGRTAALELQSQQQSVAGVTSATVEKHSPWIGPDLQQVSMGAMLVDSVLTDGTELQNPAGSLEHFCEEPTEDEDTLAGGSSQAVNSGFPELMNNAQSQDGCLLSPLQASAGDDPMSGLPEAAAAGVFAADSSFPAAGDADREVHTVSAAQSAEAKALASTASTAQAVEPERLATAISAGQGAVELLEQHNAIQATSGGAVIFVEPKVEAPELQLAAAGACLPHPNKVEKGGEDAYFVSTLHRGVIAVSDGVSGWAEEGVDPADYSRKLMLEAEAALTHIDWLATEDGVLSILTYAHRRTTMAGSATACIGLVRGGGMMLANIGDSGFRILRDGACAFASEAQTHCFNTPLQLAHPDHVPGTDVPENAQVYDMELDVGDVIVMASDGLFDNMYDDAIAALVHNILQRGGSRDAVLAQHIAEELAAHAHVAARDPSSRTPWMHEAAAAGALPFLRAMRPLGGKMDDVTVVVGFLEAAVVSAVPVPLQPQAQSTGPVSVCAGDT